ncbi:MAG: hypothetical protein AMXMBFR7_40680 [Planctomycetota bacterium]
MGGTSRNALRVSARVRREPALALAATATATAPAPRRHAKVLTAAFRPLRPGRLVRELLASNAPAAPHAWVLAAARLRLDALPDPAPERWLLRLAERFGAPAGNDDERQRCAGALARGLPLAAWNAPELLGELLLAAREAAQASSRDGRAGRQSEPCVYTPFELARRMIGSLLVGPRRTLDPACGAGIFLLAAFERAFARRRETGQPAEEAARRVLEHELAGCDLDPHAVALAEFELRLAAFAASGLSDDVPLALHAADALQPLPELEAKADIVVGNPPYVEGRGLTNAQLAALRKRFRCASRGKVNLFAVFVERGLELLRPGGVLGFVLPSTFQRNERYRALRELLLEHTLESIEPLEGKAFEGRVVEPVLLRVRKQPPARSWRVHLPGGTVQQRQLPLGPSLRFCDATAAGLREQVQLMDRHGVPLGDYFEVRDGISTGFQPFPKRLLGTLQASRFVADDATTVTFDPARHVRIVDGTEVRPFAPVAWAGRWFEYDKRHEHEPPHPGRPFNCQLRERAIFDRAEKLLTRQTARGLVATVDRERFFVRNSVHVTYVKEGALLPPLPERDRFPAPSRAVSLAALCACLNSAFYTRYFLAVTGEDGAVFPQVHIADVKRLPILPGLLREGAPLAALGEEILALHTRPESAEREADIARVRAEVEALLQAAFGLLD